MNILNSISYSEKSSKFIAYLISVSSSDEAKDVLKQLQMNHKEARHILRALRYQNQYGIYVIEASEDKEPISSMKKTASLMEKKDMKDVGIYIVRYFGGTKLGASHLDHIYFTLATKLM